MISSAALKAPALMAPVLEVFTSRQGEGICVGDAHLFIRFGGCNLTCDYCDTPDSIPSHAGRPWEMTDVLESVQTLIPQESPVVSLTGGEPLLHVQFLQHLIPALRERGCRIYLETNGTLPGALVRIVDGCDWIAMDFKPESAIGHDRWEAHRWFLNVGKNKVFVKMVLTDRTQEAEFQQAVALLSRAPETPLVLQPATPQGDVASIPLERLASWWHQASATLKDVRIIPQVHRLWQIP